MSYTPLWVLCLAPTRMRNVIIPGRMRNVKNTLPYNACCCHIVCVTTMSDISSLTHYTGKGHTSHRMIGKGYTPSLKSLLERLLWQILSEVDDHTRSDLIVSSHHSRRIGCFGQWRKCDKLSKRGTRRTPPQLVRVHFRPDSC